MKQARDSHRRRVLLAGLTTGLVLPLLVVPATAKDKYEVIELFQANSMNLEAGRAVLVEIGIYSWSTDKEREGLILAFDQKGNNGLYDHLGKQDEKGFVKFPNTMGYQMRYAIQSVHDGKRTIILGTNRPIGMGEIMRDTDTPSQNVSIVVLELDEETNKGTGSMVFGAEFGVDKESGKIEIETVATNPTKLTNVHQRKVKH